MTSRLSGRSNPQLYQIGVPRSIQPTVIAAGWKPREPTFQGFGFVLNRLTFWHHMEVPKTKRPAEAHLARLSKICLALPEATRQDSGSHAAFLVRKKTFAYFLNDHHGDGIVSLACKVLPGENTALANAQPARFYLPAYIGPRGWVALRLDIGEPDWDEVAELVKVSYRLCAPKRLAKLTKLSIR